MRRLLKAAPLTVLVVQAVQVMVQEAQPALVVIVPQEQTQLALLLE